MPLLRIHVCASFVPMTSWSLTLYGPGGLLGGVESEETQFVLGTEEAEDVWTLRGAG